MVQKHDADRVESTRKCLRNALSKCISFGGRPYLYGFQELDAAQTRLLFGDALGRVEKLRQVRGNYRWRAALLEVLKGDARA